MAKLGVKPGFKVALLGSPKGMAAMLKPWPPKVTLTARPEPDADLLLCFAKSLRELHAQLHSGGETRNVQGLFVSGTILRHPQRPRAHRADLRVTAVRGPGGGR